jgi:integrase
MGRRGNGEGSIYHREQRRTNKDGTLTTRTIWCASVSGDFGKRQVIYGRTRDEVAKKLTKALNRKDANLPFVPVRLTVGVWVDHWLETIVKVNREPTTYAKYETIIRRYVRPYLAKTSLTKLTTELLDRWQKQLTEAGVSAENRRSAMLRLGTAMQLAAARGYVERNVVSLVEKPRVERKRMNPPEVSVLKRLLTTIDGDRQRALVVMALGCSLRRAEVLGLHWEDVDLERRFARVNRRVNRVGKGIGLLVRPAAKTRAGVRVVRLPRLVVDALRAQRKLQLEDYVRAGTAWKGADYGTAGKRVTGFVFTSEVGTVLEPRRVDHYFADVRERAQLGDYTFHKLRHDFAGLLLQSDIPGRVVSEMMGHSDYSITANLYQHVPEALQLLAADRLDQVLGTAG